MIAPNELKTLNEAGLRLPVNVIGKKFRFYSKHGSHFNMLTGTILGMEYSDEGGLKLFVSVPMMWGEPLRFLRFYSGSSGWCAEIGSAESKAGRESLRGKLELL